LERLHILEGLLVAYLNIDEVIAIIRREEKPKPVLIKRFKLSEIQTEAILELKLRHLAKLEEIKIKGEKESLGKERKKIELLLSSETRLKTFIKKELRVIVEEFGDQRRCQIISDVPTAQAFNVQDMVPAENVTVVLSEKGWVKAAKGHEIDPISLNYKAGDTYLQDAKGKSNKMAFFMDSTGRSYTLLASSLPSARGQGEPLTGRLTPSIGAEFIDLVMGDDDQLVLLASDVGYGFISNLGNLKSKTKSGKNAITLPNKSKVMKIVLIEDLESQYVAVATNRGRLLIFPITELPILSKGKGNKLIQIPATDLTARKEIVTGLCALNETQKLRVYYGKRKTLYKSEDWMHFVSHRARRGKELRPGYVTNIVYITAED
jgi:topoisomerase-4 subunit A